jgi:hypothetical protein
VILARLLVTNDEPVVHRRHKSSSTVADETPVTESHQTPREGHPIAREITPQKCQMGPNHAAAFQNQDDSSDEKP